MFNNLLTNLADLLDRKIDPTKSMWRNERLREGVLMVSAAEDFQELSEALRPLSFDHGIRVRLNDLERCAAERVWLDADTQGFLRDWYAEAAEDLRGTRTIAQMVREVAQALASQAGNKQPDMRRWNAKQKMLWEIVREL